MRWFFKNSHKQKTPVYGALGLERVAGIEPASTAWKAVIKNHYTIPAECLRFSAIVSIQNVKESVN